MTVVGYVYVGVAAAWLLVPIGLACLPLAWRK